MKIGRITISDRASAGVYADRSGPEIERILREAFGDGAKFVAAIVPDELVVISNQLREFADDAACDLIVTTGGTGITPRDVTPEATRAAVNVFQPQAEALAALTGRVKDSFDPRRILNPGRMAEDL